MQRDRIALRDYVRARWWHRRLPRYPGAGFTVNAGIAVNDGYCCNARITCVAGVAGVTSVAGIAHVTGNKVIASITVITGVSPHTGNAGNTFMQLKGGMPALLSIPSLVITAFRPAMPVLLAMLANGCNGPMRQLRMVSASAQQPSFLALRAKPGFQLLPATLAQYLLVACNEHSGPRMLRATLPSYEQRASIATEPSQRDAIPFP